MLGAWKDATSLAEGEDQVFMLDMQMLSVRDILVRTLDDDVSGKSDPEVRELCLRLMTRIGVLTKNAETLLMASFLQQKHQINISQELKPFFDEAERFVKPEKDIVDEEFKVQEKQLLAKVPLLDSEDLSLQISMSYDAFTADKNFFYNYSEVRGLTRAKIGLVGNWKKVEAVNTSCKGLRGVSMVIHGDQLLVRHKGLSDEPFVAFDKTTLKQDESIKFKHPSDDDEKLKKLDWSDLKLPKEDNDDEEEEKKSEETKAEEERQRPRRLIGATPLASDGKHIYALSMQAKQEDEKGPLVYEKITLEVFEISDEKEVKRVNEVTLKKDSDGETDWNYKGIKFTSDCGYLDHAQSACNGKVFVLNLPHRTYFFKVDGGTRFVVSDKRKETDFYQMVYDCQTNVFSAFQVNEFGGYQNQLKIKGFAKRRTEEDIEKDQAPELLSEAKTKLGSEVDDGQKDWKEPEKIHMYEQLIEGKVSCSQIMSQMTENLAKKSKQKVENVHELSQAIILTTMATKADELDVDLDKLG